jgi:protein-L-isoaspartate(D-aspartate) O-methyltransferase
LRSPVFVPMLVTRLVMDPTRRELMVTDQLRRRGIRDEAVLAAFAAVPREAFVDPADQQWAYADAPLSIGFGQTISQPYVVAMTMEALALRGHERVLEIGTGSGYAAAILGALAREVHTVERIEELARTAAARLAEQGFTNVHVHHGDGSLGWPANAPYGAIAVAAGAPRPPPSLLDQLAIGGRLVIPHGDESSQRLVRITRQDARTFVEHDLGDVRFVPLVGAEGWPAGPEA